MSDQHDDHPHSLQEGGPIAPCGACKFLRRKCRNGCIFAPHFGSDQGATCFAAIHKVFGASHVSKLLLQVPMNKRQEAVASISYEAQARLSDPVYGCVSTIHALQQQIATLQAEIAMAQSQIVNNQLSIANALQSSQQQLQQISNNGYYQHGEVMQHHLRSHQPTYSNYSLASNNNNLYMNATAATYNNNDFATNISEASTAPSSHNLDLLHLSTPAEDDEEIRRNQFFFANNFMH